MNDAQARLAVTDAVFDHLLHDMKLPLNLIRVIAQSIKIDIAKSRLDAESASASMQDIVRGVDALARQIDQLRAFSRPPNTLEPLTKANLAAAC